MTAISSQRLPGNGGLINSGNGPALRKRVVRRHVKRLEKHGKDQPRFTWVSVITCIITMEAVALICFLLRTDAVFFNNPTGGTSEAIDNPFDLFVLLDTALGGGAEGGREELAELEAHLVQKTEDRLDHGHFLDHEAEMTALDNYYSRRHLDNSVPSVLVVGGIQGSGTMAILDALMQFNIQVISLEQLAVDERSKAMQFSWQKLVQIVMESGVQTVNYEFASLPESAQTAARKEWDRIKQNMPKDVARRETGIQYVFQAPDTLLLLPALQALVDAPIKFLHCVRDGRDLSLLSASISQPQQTRLHSNAEQMILDKYVLDSDLQESGNQRVVQSMQLWNDWNRDVYKWQKEHTGNRFDYLTMRTEDFLSPETKIDCLIQLSDFVNADVSVEALCCQSRQAMIKQSPEYLKNFAKAQMQSNLNTNQQDEDDRRKARLGDLLGSQFHRRRYIAGNGESRDDMDRHRRDRFQDVGERLVARMTSDENAVLKTGIDRRLLASHLRRRLEGNDQETISKLLAGYSAWRKTFPKAMYDEAAAQATAETGEKLLAQYRANEQELEGILTEQSFTRSIKWLRSIHQTGNQPLKLSSYGRWAQILNDQPLLAERIQAIGEESLEAFGYEPMTRFIDFDPGNRKAQCHTKIVCTSA